MEIIAFQPDAKCLRSDNPTDPDWQSAMADAVTDVRQLRRLLDLPEGIGAPPEDVSQDFPLLVPRPFLARIRPGDPRDPLLLQILPQSAELAQQPGYCTDPVGEHEITRWAGVLWKYPGRLLIVTTRDCAVHCRFCFRRHFRPQQTPLVGRIWDSILAGIKAEPSVHEVILSGRDPLALEDVVLSRVVDQLAAISHVERVRIHTRFPMVLPQRVTEEMLAWVRHPRLTVVFVVHVNHPAEIDASVAAALARLADAGVPLLSQSVLLRGVNDDVEVLAGLCERLANLRVMPYYLHQLDRVAGAAHFEVPEETGVERIRQLRARLPGYAVPRYVRETVGETSKRVLA